MTSTPGVGEVRDENFPFLIHGEEVLGTIPTTKKPYRMI
jgi:hypothetical protein